MALLVTPWNPAEVYGIALRSQALMQEQQQAAMRNAQAVLESSLQARRQDRAFAQQAAYQNARLAEEQRQFNALLPIKQAESADKIRGAAPFLGIPGSVEPPLPEVAPATDTATAPPAVEVAPPAVDPGLAAVNALPALMGAPLGVALPQTGTSMIPGTDSAPGGFTGLPETLGAPVSDLPTGRGTAPRSLALIPEAPTNRISRHLSGIADYNRRVQAAGGRPPISTEAVERALPSLISKSFAEQKPPFDPISEAAARGYKRGPGGTFVDDAGGHWQAGSNGFYQVATPESKAKEGDLSATERQKIINLRSARSGLVSEVENMAKLAADPKKNPPPAVVWPWQGDGEAKGDSGRFYKLGPGGKGRVEIDKPTYDSMVTEAQGKLESHRRLYADPIEKARADIAKIDAQLEKMGVGTGLQPASAAPAATDDKFTPASIIAAGGKALKDKVTGEIVFVDKDGNRVGSIRPNEANR